MQQLIPAQTSQTGLSHLLKTENSGLAYKDDKLQVGLQERSIGEIKNWAKGFYRLRLLQELQSNLGRQSSLSQSHSAAHSSLPRPPQSRA